MASSTTSQLLWQAIITLDTFTWLAFHRVALNRGFLFKRRGFSTDTLFGLAISASSIIWTSLAVVYGAPGVNDGSSHSLATVLAHSPLLILNLSILWMAVRFDCILPRYFWRNGYQFWNLSVISGPFDWMNCIKPPMFWTFCTLTSIIILMVSISAIIDEYVLQGVSNIIGLGIFFLAGTLPNPYIKAPHRYQGDMLRVILPTSHNEGTVYILPSTSRGFDAILSPKVENEHIEADQHAMTLFEHMRSGRWSPKEPLERIRSIVSSYQRRVILDAEELENLAKWIYLGPSHLDSGDMREIQCLRAKDTHLIGRDLIYALCHAEYLVFMGQARLSPFMRDKLGVLRLMKRSGASLSTGDTNCIGFKPGYEGYKEAVEYIYRIFQQPIDFSALNFHSTAPPKYSPALGKSPDSINNYVAELWDLCCEYSESTFTALYMFTLIWFMELGNCNGFHIFPLRCKDRAGDFVSQAIVWRQAWYAGVICQLVSASPVLFAAFVAGYIS